MYILPLIVLVRSIKMYCIICTCTFALKNCVLVNLELDRAGGKSCFHQVGNTIESQVRQGRRVYN